MSRYDDLMRLAYEADDLAEALDEVLSPVRAMVGRMRWSGPHRDRVQAELGTMIAITGAIAGRLRDRAKVLRRAAEECDSGLSRVWHELGDLL